MSDTALHRADHNLPATKLANRRGAQPTVAKPFDAAKAAIKAASEPKPVEARGLYSQVIAEAMDGDGSEAVMRATMESGKRPGDDNEVGRLASTRKGEKSSGSRVVHQVQVRTTPKVWRQRIDVRPRSQIRALKVRGVLKAWGGPNPLPNPFPASMMS